MFHKHIANFIIIIVENCINIGKHNLVLTLYKFYANILLVLILSNVVVNVFYIVASNSI